MPNSQRRVFLGRSGGALSWIGGMGLAPTWAHGAGGGPVAGAGAGMDPRDQALAQAIRAFVGAGTLVRQSPRVHLEIDPLVENGNSVPVRVRVGSAMTEQEHVQRILVLAPRNPQPQVAIFHLGPHSGRAEVATRFRMAESQAVLALAQCSDGSVHEARAEVIVTLAACLET